MDTNVPAQHPANTASTRNLNWPLIILLVAVLGAGSAALVVNCLSSPEPVVEKKEPKGAVWSYEELFPNWPKDRKPEFVIAVTGQTYGYLQKCGCSDPQKGGLERRFNFFEGFKAHGIEIIPIDLGDLPPQLSEDSKILNDQAKLKYTVAMRAMKAMGYRVVGLGKEEFVLGLLDSLGEFSLQPGNEQPRIVATNLLGYKFGNQILDKKTAFPLAVKDEGGAIRDWEIIPTASKVNLGVVAVVGDPIVQAVKKIDPNVVFAEPPQSNSAKAIAAALGEMAKSPLKPAINVLLYAGPNTQPDFLAEKAAAAFPQFQIVVCQSEESEPPAVPKMLVNPAVGQNTMLVRVGHKGQNVGVIGAFKNEKGGLDLHYQKVTLNPEFETPNGQEANNVALQELERYSKLVKDRGYLTRNRKVLHPLQVLNPKAEYAGSQSCMACHLGHDTSWTTWTGSKHSHAYAALENIAKKPSLRNFDGECIRCHTVGYDYKTGFVDTVKTPNLVNVGCESCHGPGSQHNSNPGNKALALEMSPWKVNGEGKMPSAETLKAFLEERDPAKKQKMIDAKEMQVMLRVDRTCQTCHNAENDPHFKIETFWPKIAHSSKPVAKAISPTSSKDPKAKDEPVGLPATPPPLPLPLPPGKE